MWIAFRFCIFVLWTQSVKRRLPCFMGCELLSDFVYSFFEHNKDRGSQGLHRVVNCFQILYIRSLNTITIIDFLIRPGLWIAFRFCIFVLWTQFKPYYGFESNGCELLSDFVYSFFEHNVRSVDWQRVTVVFPWKKLTRKC